jgi:hypothetical protein
MTRSGSRLSIPSSVGNAAVDYFWEIAITKRFVVFGSTSSTVLAFRRDPTISVCLSKAARISAEFKVRTTTRSGFFVNSPCDQSFKR